MWMAFPADSDRDKGTSSGSSGIPDWIMSERLQTADKTLVDSQDNVANDEHPS